jgi:hypothetical protein
MVHPSDSRFVLICIFSVLFLSTTANAANPPFQCRNWISFSVPSVSDYSWVRKRCDLSSSTWGRSWVNPETLVCWICDNADVMAVTGDPAGTKDGTEEEDASCTAVTGEWQWFNGGRPTFDASGAVLSGGGRAGEWSCSGSEIIVRWGDPLMFEDTLTLSADGRELTGHGRNIASGATTRSGHFGAR